MTSATLDPFGLISWLGIFRIFDAGGFGLAFGRSIPIRTAAVKDAMISRHVGEEM